MEKLNLNTNINNQQWYQAFIDDITAALVEKEFTSKWELIEGYHDIGLAIMEKTKEFENANIYGEEITKRVSQSINRSQRLVQKMVQFAKMFPSLSDLKAGKNISWNKICNEYLPEHREKPTPPMLPPANELKERLLKYADYLVDNAKITVDAVMFVMPHDLK